ncbi:MAG: nucleoside triphosphate pyrophosphohydrolase [Bacteroidetes bacterium SW_9_63_38]|nr:MAG: nucleoside triphosphate pyrophosphohydrolase [Bacteroidetes bacterium SW_9_63_38]
MANSGDDATDKIYEAPFAESDERLEAYADFVAIVKQLRRDCPWDREQTHESVKHLLIEEAYEVVEAIDHEDWDELAEELGDVFLHVLFHSVIAEQEGHFDLADVIAAETDKLVRRHPHVFGDDTTSDADDVAASWEEIKQQEEDGEQTSVLAGVPSQLPALLRASRSQEKAAGVGFDFLDREASWAKVEEELSEFQAAVAADDADNKEEEFGDLLFALTNYARQADINPEEALRRTNDKFIRRVQHIEERLDENGSSLAEADLETAAELWAEAKDEE